jgi:hypothetical protein
MNADDEIDRSKRYELEQDELRSWKVAVLFLENEARYKRDQQQ